MAKDSLKEKNKKDTRLKEAKAKETKVKETKVKEAKVKDAKVKETKIREARMKEKEATEASEVKAGKEDLAKETDSKEKKCKCKPEKTKKRSEKEKRDLINRLSRIEGQVRGIKRMVEEDSYCPDILVQAAAVNAAMNAFNKALLAEHIQTCVANDIREGRDESIEELVTVLQKVMK